MAKSLMIQGTCSNSGKSIMVAGLCRIFFEDGYRVAPFKAQNMALNSFVTKANCEMGRAQANQAFACRIQPDVRMNPILLKPTSDSHPQVIINGKPLRNMNFNSYKDMKEQLKEVIQEAYSSLCKDFDIVVIEGAGSPAEVNLKDDDIVNMFVARFSHAPVIIVGDIDRGGVFAHFVGTLELFDELERDITKGFIINKFRGDIELLKPGVEILEKRTFKKVFGVVPYIHDLQLPDEDSVEFKKKVGKSKIDCHKDINIALIDLPHISNCTDFDPFDYEDDVNIFSVSDPEALQEADMVIIPGTKNVIGDMRYLKHKGFFKALSDFFQTNKTIIGICGGYQILGETISDPHCIEGKTLKESGLGFLKATTILKQKKRLKQIKAFCVDSGCVVSGYEIHHGSTEIRERPFIVSPEHEILGCINKKGNVWGSYIHGVFDDDCFRRYVLNKIRMKKQLPSLKQNVYSIEKEFVKLAGILRQSLDLKNIYSLMRL